VFPAAFAGQRVQNQLSPVNKDWREPDSLGPVCAAAKSRLLFLFDYFLLWTLDAWRLMILPAWPRRTSWVPLDRSSDPCDSCSGPSLPVLSSQEGDCLVRCFAGSQGVRISCPRTMLAFHSFTPCFWPNRSDPPKSRQAFPQSLPKVFLINYH